MANHEIVYGICENKCQHEVYGKTAADEQFLSKTTASNSYAIKNHTDNKGTYGIASERVYGHVRLTDALNRPAETSEGIALQASAGKELNDKITELKNTVATDRVLGMVKMTDIPISANTGSSAEYALSAVGANNLKTSLQLPVNAVICVTIPLANEMILANTLGYGTWEAVGDLQVGRMTLSFYRRTA